MHIIPKRLFLTKGVGRDREQLASYELALRDAGIAAFNIVTVSSIFPPGCKMVSQRKGLALLKPGEIVFAVQSRCATNEAHRMVAASIGVAIPADPARYGYLSEHHAFGQKEQVAGDYAEDLAATMLASTLGLDLDLDRAWDDRREQWRIAGRIVRTTNVTQSSIGKNGVWTTVIAAGVFCD